VLQEASGADGSTVDLSIAIPCYNEEDCLPRTIPPLASALAQGGVSFEIVLVDNGSTDRTGEIIDELARSGLPIVKGKVDVNRGVGLGFRTGFALSQGAIVSTLCADGQVAPEDLLRVYEAIHSRREPAIVKVRRRFRRDSFFRKVISVAYNGLMHALFPGLQGLDLNGNPKLLPRTSLERMALRSDDWFLDAEIMLKARHLRLPVIEIDVPGHAREGGTSNVTKATVLEFLRNILRYRMGGPWRDWKRENSR
jgi:glycosyltransferase involved in cell wall biosynthesis